MIEYRFQRGATFENEAYPNNLPQFDAPHRVLAEKEGTTVGQLSWKPRTGEISDVFVERPFRRQGIGREMFRQAIHLSSQFEGVLAPKHSEHRTEEGDAWANAVGGEVPSLTPYKRPFSNMWDE